MAEANHDASKRGSEPPWAAHQYFYHILSKLFLHDAWSNPDKPTFQIAFSSFFHNIWVVIGNVAAYAIVPASQ